MHCPLQTGSTRCVLRRNSSQKHGTQQLDKATLLPFLHLAVSEHAQQHFAVTLKCLLGFCSLQSRSWWALTG